MHDIDNWVYCQANAESGLKEFWESSSMHLNHVAPIQHEVGIGAVVPEVGSIADKKPEVGLQEFVAIVRLRPLHCPSLTPTPPWASPSAIALRRS